MEAPAKTLGRRGVLAGGLGALVAAALGRVSTAKAATGDPLLLGTSNTADETTSVIARPPPSGTNGGGGGDAFEVAFGDGSVRVLLGAGSLGGTGVFGQAGKPRQSQPWTTAAAGWFTGGENPGAIGISDSHIGVIGLSGPVAPISPTELDPAGAHFVGAGEASGVCARSDSMPGVLGMSSTNVGLVGATGGATENEDALYSLMASGVHGIGATEPGVCGRSEAIGVLGESKAIGMWGAAGPTEVDVTQVPAFATGVWGQGTGQSVGVLGSAPLIGVWGAASATPPGPPILPAVQTPSGLWGQTDLANGVGVLARHQTGGGTALAVEGRAAFAGVGGGTLDRRGDAFIGDPHISADSHVIVTLQGDPGKGAPWVDITPGKGFAVHMTEATNRKVPFSYLVLDAREAASRT
jgi:hypothetical protein